MYSTTGLILLLLRSIDHKTRLRVIAETNAISPEPSDRPQNQTSNATKQICSFYIILYHSFLPPWLLVFFERRALARAANVGNQLIDKPLLIVDQVTGDKTVIRFFMVPAVNLFIWINTLFTVYSGTLFAGSPLWSLVYSVSLFDEARFHFGNLWWHQLADRLAPAKIWKRVPHIKWANIYFPK